MDYELFKSGARDGEAKQERIERLEKERKIAMDAYVSIANSVRSNRSTMATRNIGTLTMIFGAATSVGLLVFKEPTLVNIFASVALAGLSIAGNRKIHRRTTLKMNMHKQMVIKAEKMHAELTQLDVKTTKLDKITIPTYEALEKEAREYVAKNKRKILRKSNYKTIRNTMTSFATIATMGAIFNYTEKEKITTIEAELPDLLTDMGTKVTGIVSKVKNALAP